MFGCDYRHRGDLLLWASTESVGLSGVKCEREPRLASIPFVWAMPFTYSDTAPRPGLAFLALDIVLLKAPDICLVHFDRACELFELPQERRADTVL